MCELFGVSSAKKVKCNELLQVFYSHGVDNPDGWGLATFYENAVSLEKEPVSSMESVYLKNRLTDEIVEDTLLAHIRKASKGGLEYKNAHPFIRRDSSGRLWTLIHNGTIFESTELDSYMEQQKGSTDSERILYYLIDRINAKQKEKGSELTEKERFTVVDEVVHTITPGNKVNLLIYDGDLFYAHTNLKDTLHRCQQEHTLIVATKPLVTESLDQDSWEKVPMNTLLAYRHGELVHVGETPTSEYIDVKEAAATTE